MKKFLRISLWVLGTAIAALAAAVLLLEHRTFEAPFPAIAASSDPAVIERGRYLVTGPAHCTSCHGAPDQLEAQVPVESVPLSGGFEFKLPFGVVRASNLTSDPETGIGAVSDEALARSLRHGVRADGTVLLPFMPFSDLSDEDLRAIVSFLRTQPPVRNAVKTREFNFVGRAVLAFLIKPQGPNGPLPAQVDKAPTVEYGHYLAHKVASCYSCHTERNMMTGEFVGPTMAGGTPLPSHDDPAVLITPPNLTPDPDTGRMAGWTEEVFVARMKLGVGPPGSKMPWSAYARMSEDDLRAVYRYLQSLPPVKNDTNAPAAGEPVAQSDGA